MRALVNFDQTLADATCLRVVEADGDLTLELRLFNGALAKLVFSNNLGYACLGGDAGVSEVMRNADGVIVDRLRERTKNDVDHLKFENFVVLDPYGDDEFFVLAESVELILE